MINAPHVLVEIIETIAQSCDLSYHFRLFIFDLGHVIFGQETILALPLLEREGGGREGDERDPSTIVFFFSSDQE